LHEVDALRTEIELLRETNRRLNRRANGEDAYWMRRAMKAEALSEMWRSSYSHTFDRMMNAFDELKQIYVAIRGKPPQGFHSVMDWRFGPEPAGDAVYANPFGRPSERVVDVVLEMVKER
jgi:hypothetical protein